MTYRERGKYWACACMEAIKLHHPRNKKCRVCKATRPEQPEESWEVLRWRGHRQSAIVLGSFYTGNYAGGVIAISASIAIDCVMSVDSDHLRDLTKMVAQPVVG